MTKTARWITEHISSYIIRGSACILVCGRVSWYVTFEMTLHIVIVNSLSMYMIKIEIWNVVFWLAAMYYKA